MTSPAATARRFAGYRPGFELVHYEEVGLPYYRLVLDALIQQRKPIGPIEEFLLRSVEAGLDRIDDITGLLGVERALLERAVVALNQQDHLDYRLEGEARVLRITPLGTRALSGWKEMTPGRDEVLIGFDRLTWMPTGRHYRSLIRPQDARAAGLRILPPRLKKRLRPPDIDLDAAQIALEDVARQSLKNADLIAVKDVGNHQMVLPAVALVYASEASDDQQVAIVIDGRPSEDHETAFAEIDGPTRSGLLVEGRAPDDEQPDLALSHTLTVGDRATVRELEQRIATASAALQRAHTLTETAAASAVEDAEASGFKSASASDLEEAEQELAALSVRTIQTYEHRALLEEALTNTKRRLLVISPWIRGDVVDSTFLRQLGDRLNTGTDVHIGWGIGDGEDGRERAPLQRLRELSERYDRFVLRRLGNTHAKILIWDDHLVVTSFNWLSFRGDRDRGFRQEEGILITASDVVEPEYEKYRSQIMSVRE